MIANQNDLIVDFEETINNGPFPIRFPKSKYSQDEEWCEVNINNEWQKIRFHDYHQVYKVPGLYETIFYRTLRCNSPNRISGFINDVCIELGLDINGFKALDLGAGNGMSGEALQSLGIRKIVGIDILAEAKEATIRDRPWVYDNYLTADLTNLSGEDSQFLKNYKFNLLCTIAALGFGDIPVRAFYQAYNLVQNNGLIAFNIKDEFLKKTTNSPFAKLIDTLIQEEYIQMEFYKKYQHRLNTMGQPLYYIGLVATKHKDIPLDLVERF